MPFVVSWPGKLPAGKTFDRPLIQLDIQPTVLAAAGVEVQPDWKLDGTNVLPYLQGETRTVPHDTLYLRFGEQMALRRGDWKLVAMTPWPTTGNRAPYRQYGSTTWLMILAKHTIWPPCNPSA